MKKNSIAGLQITKGQMRRLGAKQRLTVGVDIGDRTSRYCVLDEAGDAVSQDQLPTTKTGLNSLFEKMAACRIALEVGTHSPWVSRQLKAMGHEVIVANPRKVKLITREREEERPDGRRAVGTAGPSGPEVAFADSTPRRKSAGGPGGSAGPDGVGGCADGDCQQRAAWPNRWANG